MDNQTFIRELLREIGELEALIAKATHCDAVEGRWGAGMLQRLLRRRRHALWCFQQSGAKGVH
ncbi:MAG TPA: hypothetical protein VGE50_00050 [Gammaproteobacteria bacterium]